MFNSSAASKPAVSFGFGPSSSNPPAFPSSTTANTTGFGFTAGGGANNTSVASNASAPAASTGFGTTPGATGTGGFGSTTGGNTGFGSSTQFGGGGGGFNSGFANKPAVSFPGMGGVGFQTNMMNNNNSNMMMPLQQQQQQQQQNQTFHALDRQNHLATLLSHLDSAYSALSSNCRFRTFVFNHCEPGRGKTAVVRDLYIAKVHNAELESLQNAYMEAYHDCPDEDTMYPYPLYFIQGLFKRVEFQKLAIKEYHAQIDALLARARTVTRKNEENRRAFKDLQQEDVMLLRRWHLIVAKVEVLRRMGLSSDEEDHIARQIQLFQQQLYASGQYYSALKDLTPYLDDEEYACNLILRMKEQGKRGRSLAESEYDADTKREMSELVANIEKGIAGLHSLIQKDLHDMKEASARV